eukprot:CAMPEP_0179000786 /NCGR_PEP_ID=MMETSP0795-20121207/10912_1 /TAXON_ID=88552 /ORGANISM="Amoebophrya sp., Strain Ameob2" /LENGTH=423 /DNA_ID=CAMNT_0020693915 /DNA_START=293 /DNA_END=1564 /DNA_ORIENTATION=+
MRGRPPRFLPFEEARQYMQTCGATLRRYVDFQEWSISDARPAFIPSRPDIVYAKQGWAGFPDFLGYERVALRTPGRDREYSADQRASALRRRSAHADFLHRLNEQVDGYEIRRLSFRWPSIILLRKRTPAGAPLPDAWIAASIKFGSAYANARARIAGKLVFHNTMRNRDVGVIFVSDGASDVLLQRAEEITGPKTLDKRYSTLCVEEKDLKPFDAREVCEILSNWWENCETKSVRDWSISLGGASLPTWLQQHDTAWNLVENLLYHPLKLNAERVFPLDACDMGNLMLSGVRCLQRRGRLRYSRGGYLFNVDRFWFANGWRPGRKRESQVQRYICIIPKEAGPGDPLGIAGVFILPRECVFSEEMGGELSRRNRLFLYPPFSRPLHKKAQLRQEEHCKYYVDLEAAADRDYQLSRAKALLGV